MTTRYINQILQSFMLYPQEKILFSDLFLGMKSWELYLLLLVVPKELFFS